MRKFVKFTECEIVDNKIVELLPVYINPDKVIHLGETEGFKGYSYIGLDNGKSIVKGTPKEIIKKIRGNIWHKILNLLS